MFEVNITGPWSDPCGTPCGRKTSKPYETENCSAPFIAFVRVWALKDMLESIARAEDIVKVHEARLTEKETTSLSPDDVNEYTVTLKVFYAIE